MSATRSSRLASACVCLETAIRRAVPDVHPRLTFGVLSLVILASGALYWATVASTPGLLERYAGIDYRLYMNATSQWLSGGAFYAPWQATGPYALVDQQGFATGAILYPPIALYLFVPFTRLQPVLWWGVPLALTAWGLWRLHPAPIAWPLMALCLWYPTSGLKILTGNPTMWVLAAVALGVLYHWPFVGVLVKPSLFPFALLGVRHRSWWVALLVLSLAGLPFAFLWRDWVVALLNAQGGGLLYSVQEVPLLCLPLAACVGRARAPRPWAGHGPTGAPATRLTIP